MKKVDVKRSRDDVVIRELSRAEQSVLDKVSGMPDEVLLIGSSSFWHDIFCDLDTVDISLKRSVNTAEGTPIGTS